MSTPSEAEATIAVDAAARKAWDLRRAALRDQGYATPEFDALGPGEKLRVREQVLPLVWAALESLERPAAAPEHIRPDFAAVLADHAGCRLNDSRDGFYASAGETGQDFWSCGIRLPFTESLDDAERAHLAAALDAALDAEA